MFRRIRLMAVAAVMFGALAGPAAAQMVYIDAGDGAEGRGVAMRANGRCYALAPAHVANLGGSFTVRGLGRTTSRARVVKTFDNSEAGAPVDLAIFELEPGGDVACDQALPDTQTISRTLQAASQVILQRVNARGELRNSPALIRNVSPGDLSMSVSSDPDDQLHQGDSGSLVVADRVPVAMFVSKTEDGGSARYIAIRLDTMLALANNYFASLRAPVRAFQYRSFEVVDQTATGLQARPSGTAATLPRFIASLAPELRAETERLLSGTRGFPPIDNQSSADQVATGAHLSLAVINVDAVRNSCRSRRGKLFGIETTYFEATTPGSICINGFQQFRSILRITFRMSGMAEEGTGGARAPIVSQFSLVVPDDTGQITLPLTGELSQRLCAATKGAVERLAPVRGRPSGGGLFTSNEIVPNLANQRLRVAC
ncbi:hypothetical protein ACO2Q1_01690 [Brevundimonas sp. VNH65]|uniref:hypothetical protein n=1 Tax=Brevundimonas sp. VNH65 TaxID=3400917 RepID=UPI003BFA7EFD